MDSNVMPSGSHEYVVRRIEFVIQKEPFGFLAPEPIELLKRIHKVMDSDVMSAGLNTFM